MAALHLACAVAMLTVPHACATLWVPNVLASDMVLPSPNATLWVSELEPESFCLQLQLTWLCTIHLLWYQATHLPAKFTHQ